VGVKPKTIGMVVVMHNP